MCVTVIVALIRDLKAEINAAAVKVCKVVETAWDKEKVQVVMVLVVGWVKVMVSVAEEAKEWVKGVVIAAVIPEEMVVVTVMVVAVEIAGLVNKSSHVRNHFKGSRDSSLDPFCFVCCVLSGLVYNF